MADTDCFGLGEWCLGNLQKRLLSEKVEPSEVMYFAILATATGYGAEVRECFITADLKIAIAYESLVTAINIYLEPENKLYRLKNSLILNIAEDVLKKINEFEALLRLKGIKDGE